MALAVPPPLPSPIQLLQRSCVVTVGSVQVSNIGQQMGLDVWFSVKKSLKPRTPQSCDLRLYNLSDSTRKAIEQSAQPLPPPGGGAPVASITNKATGEVTSNTATPVQIVAGYVGATSTIFLGELRSAQTVTDGADTVTELQVGDADQASIKARISQTFGAGANALMVAKALIAVMGCGAGNIATVASVLSAAPCYTKGVVAKGAALDHLCDLAKSCGLEVTLQNGNVLQWLSMGEPLGGQAYLFQTTPTNTGVIGSPSVDTKGVLALDVLMVPGLLPGNPIVVQTKYISGPYRICSMETVGDTHSNDWHHSLECKRNGLAP